jgi:glycine/D-amino acid oxidase-like deaminating enzyme
MTEESYDVIVVGSGAAGLTAASVAASQRQRTLLVEHAPVAGGTTAISGGMVWIPANEKMKAAGIADSLKAARLYLRQTLPPDEGDPVREAFLQRGDEALRYLEAHTALRLRPVVRYPDYYPDLPGATAGGRVLESLPFDASELGLDFVLMRPPLPEFMAFGGMMISREDMPHFRRMARSPRSAWHVAKLIARYGLQRLRAHRGTTLYLGNALIGRLLKSARALGVEIRLQASVVSLLKAGDGRIRGVELAQADGVPRRVIANKGVVLATGGISHDAGLRSQHVPASAGTLSATVCSGAAKSGVRLAQEAGARTTTPAHSRAFWVPASIFTRRDGSQGVFPHTVTDRAKPGLIAVDRQGHRFVNEAVSYHEFVQAQLRHANTAIPAWLVCDRKFLWKYGLGRIKPFTVSLGAFVADGYLKRAATMVDLGKAIGVPPEALAETVQTFNESAANGLDPAFQRGSDIYQRHLGDGDHQPNPCVAPINAAPFFAVAVHPADLGMAAGLVTDERARVLDAAGRPMAGLWACGNDMHSLMNGAYPAPGITLGPALVFGYIAACDACSEVVHPGKRL